MGHLLKAKKNECSFWPKFVSRIQLFRAGKIYQFIDAIIPGRKSMI
jgi:hypothetical protein